MRTYQKNEPQKKKISKRTLVAMLSSFAILVAAFAVSLPLVLSKQPPKEVDEPVIGQKPIAFGLPLSEYTIGLDFKIDELVYSSTLNQWRTHSGVDFLAQLGSSVAAIANGTVSDIKTTTLEGTVITITHIDGYASVYKSLSENVPVAVGDEVSIGDIIGYVDITMITEQAEGAHLHLELYKNNNLVNPLDFIPHDGDK